MKLKYEAAVFMSLGLLGVFLSIVDIAGLAQHYRFLEQRLPALTLLAVGIVLSYLAWERSTSLTRTEDMIQEGFEKVVYSLAGGAIVSFTDSAAMYEYFAARIRAATRSIEDVTWGLLPSTQRTKAQRKAFAEYKEAQRLAMSRPAVIYREMMSFPPAQIGAARIERVERVVGEDWHGYEVRYFSFPHEEAPPLPQFAIVDSEEVILTFRHATATASEDLYLAVRHPGVVQWFKEYYDVAWAKGRVLKEAGEEVDLEVLGRIKSQLTSFSGKQTRAGLPEEVSSHVLDSGEQSESQTH